MIPVYAFAVGDTLGLVILLDEDQTMGSVAQLLQASASVRVAPRSGFVVLHEGRPVDPCATVASLGVRPLDRIDLVEPESP
jgi:Toluene-4-monooxygenase system protein B (TmoB)